ncbi:anthrone oxygenase family protein [Luteimonas sp. R10]|uniref:anthrone oxygenase family protein n=1 Tax=Luteimonas sp. R10 TaxID=3108176 RepID=UPI0030911999|nr:anthrone oxygenase family protein [Luteimonas sp. R10]
MAFALAHAAELPGKLRLDKTAYLATQPIYHPGFTIGGISEPLAILALAALSWLVRDDRIDLLLVLASLVLVSCMQVVYWLAVHPVNKFWLADRALPPVSAGFFGLGKAPSGSGAGVDKAWRGLRDRWEYAHAARAVLAFVAFVLLGLHVVRP